MGAFAYDDNGNPTTYNGTSATYDPENHLLTLGSTYSADYQASGLRAWKANSSGTRTYFLYDGSTPIIEMDATGAATAVNTFGANGLISRRNISANASVFHAFDERGNVVQYLDSVGKVINARSWDAFGVYSGTTGNPNDPFAFGGQHGYVSDTETAGLILCGLRYYDPSLGQVADPRPGRLCGRD